MDELDPNTSITRSVCDAIDISGRAAESIRSAVVVGHGDGEVVAELHRRAPNLRDVLVIEPDARVVSDYAHDVHLELMAWMLEKRAVLAQTAWVLDPTARRVHGVRFQAIAHAVEDLFWSASSRFVDRVDGLGLLDAWLGGPSAPRFRGWADALFEQGAVHPALRWYLLLHRVMPDPGLARRIGIAWGKLGSPLRALAWLKRSDLPSAAVRAAAVDLQAAQDAARSEAAIMLATNLEHLQREWPDVAAVIERTDSSTADVAWISDVPWRLRIEGDRGIVKRDVYPLLVEERDGRLCELNLPEHPSRLRAQLEGRASMTKRHACVGAVRDYASLVNVLRNRVVSTLPGWRQGVYAVESRPAVLRRLLEAVDMRDVLRKGALESLDVGEHSERTLVDFFRAHPRRPLPRVRLACAAGIARGFEDVERERTARGHAALASTRARDDLQWPTRVLAKLRSDQPLRVWVWTSIHTTVLQHVARGLAQGFSELGHTAELLVESDPREQLEAPEVASSLAAFDPDLAVFIDHARPEYGSLLPRTLPVACWILDELPLLADTRVVGQLGAFDLAFAWSRPLTDDYLRRGYPHCEQLPFAVDPATYGRPADAPAEDSVAYATHLSFPYEPAYAPGLYRELERRMMAMADVPSGIEPLAPLLDETVGALGIRVPSEERRDLSYQCLMVARHVDRVRVADRMLAAGIPVALYGRGWAEIERFAPYARGLVEPGDALRRMYQRHKVVLHINTRCNLHPRVLEAAAAGAFVLARSDGDWDFAPGSVGDYLAVGRELCVFEDGDDMIAKIRRAFADESWRQGFVQSARARVHRDHTYAQRAQRIVAALGRRLARVLGAADAA